MPSSTMALRGNHGRGYEDGGAAAPPGQGQCWVGEVTEAWRRCCGLHVSEGWEMTHGTSQDAGIAGGQSEGSALSCSSLLTSKAEVPVTVRLRPVPLLRRSG